MGVRLRVALLSLKKKHPGASTPKQHHLRERRNPFYCTPCVIPPKIFNGIFHSNPKLPILIPTATSFAASLTPSVTHAQQSKEPQKALSKFPIQEEKSKILPKDVSHNVRGLIFTRYIDYVRNYDRILEKNFPAAFKLYRTFFDGVSDFYHDMKWYAKIWRVVHSSPNGLSVLNLKELELYMKMPKDMIKVAPAIIGTSIPIIGYAFFTLIFMYPRQLLTSHFWTPQQRHEFQRMHLQKRFTNSKLIVNWLHKKLKNLKSCKQYELIRVLAIIDHKSTYSPTAKDLLCIKDLFAEPPYSLKSLGKRHLKLLSGMHGLNGLLPSRLKLKEHATLIQHMDRAIQREGGVKNMPLAALQRACAIRGLNPANMSKRDLKLWLDKWIAVTTTIQEQHMSLLLHLPIFLAFNHPNNWKLYTHTNRGLKLKSNSTKNL